jgi:hypothetical protein
MMAQCRLESDLRELSGAVEIRLERGLSPLPMSESKAAAGHLSAPDNLR